ncbi:NB-ARC domains-containing protein [Tanacetum coccineum]
MSNTEQNAEKNCEKGELGLVEIAYFPWYLFTTEQKRRVCVVKGHDDGEGVLCLRVQNELLVLPGLALAMWGIGVLPQYPYSKRVLEVSLSEMHGIKREWAIHALIPAWNRLYQVVALAVLALSRFPSIRAIAKGEIKQLNIEKEATPIEESRFLIIIFSKNYASSSWCLRELVKILERKQIENPKHEVRIIFYDAKPDAARKQKRSYAEAFREHEISNSTEVGKWKEALSMAADLSGFDLQEMTYRYEYKFIDCISEERPYSKYIYVYIISEGHDWQYWLKTFVGIRFSIFALTDYGCGLHACLGTYKQDEDVVAITEAIEVLVLLLRKSSQKLVKVTTYLLDMLRERLSLKYERLHALSVFIQFGDGILFSEFLEFISGCLKTETTVLQRLGRESIRLMKRYEGEGKDDSKLAYVYKDLSDYSITTWWALALYVVGGRNELLVRE